MTSYHHHHQYYNQKSNEQIMMNSTPFVMHEQQQQQYEPLMPPSSDEDDSLNHTYVSNYPSAIVVQDDYYKKPSVFHNDENYDHHNYYTCPKQHITDWNYKTPLPKSPRRTRGKNKTSTGPPKFLRKLYTLLNDETTQNVICWSAGGDAIQIFDIDSMPLVLSQYYKHIKYASFQRQLNYFGFKKWTKTMTDICTFSHPSFLKSKPELMTSIRRKNTPEKPGSRPFAAKKMADNITSSWVVSPTAAVTSSLSPPHDNNWEELNPTSFSDIFSFTEASERFVKERNEYCEFALEA